MAQCVDTRRFPISTYRFPYYTLRFPVEAGVALYGIGKRQVLLFHNKTLADFSLLLLGSGKCYTWRTPTIPRTTPTFTGNGKVQKSIILIGQSAFTQNLIGQRVRSINGEPESANWIALSVNTLRHPVKEVNWEVFGVGC